jgi:hypothetical protein
MILALASSSATRYLAQTSHNAALGPAAVTSAESGSNLSNMNSYSLALLLGGLRGPLVMLLWTSSENQKQQKDLEDFDTKVEWIRLLQPEFDTVHLFEIWNKAYNISVQMSSLANKYDTILDALDYAHSVLKARPDDINILGTVASLYFDKLGHSAEKVYYKGRVRDESMPRMKVTAPASDFDQFNKMVDHIGADENDMRVTNDAAAKTFSATMNPAVAGFLEKVFSGPDITYELAPPPPVHPNDPGWRRTQLDPVLDASGYVLPALTEPTQGRPQSDTGYDGAEMQYLPQFAPYPYGVATMGIAYNYYRRVQALQDLGERHIQMSDMVLDARPALTARFWAEDEIERGRKAEFRLFKLPIPELRVDMDVPTAKLLFDFDPAATEARAEAIASYDLAARLAKTAIDGYVAHVQKYPNNQTVYLSHIDHVRGLLPMAEGDRDYLQAANATGAERMNLLDAAKAEYAQATLRVGYMILRYYIPSQMASKVYPKGVARDNIDRVDPRLYPLLVDRFNALYPAFRAAGNQDEYEEDRGEYEAYRQRCEKRYEVLTQMH